MRVITVAEKLKIAKKLFDKHNLIVEHSGISYALQIEELKIITKLLNKHGLSAEYAKQCNALQEISEPAESTIPVTEKENDNEQ